MPPTTKRAQRLRSSLTSLSSHTRAFALMCCLIRGGRRGPGARREWKRERQLWPRPPGGTRHATPAINITDNTSKLAAVAAAAAAAAAATAPTFQQPLLPPSSPNAPRAPLSKPPPPPRRNGALICSHTPGRGARAPTRTDAREPYWRTESPPRGVGKGGAHALHRTTHRGGGAGPCERTKYTHEDTQKTSSSHPENKKAARTE